MTLQIVFKTVFKASKPISNLHKPFQAAESLSNQKIFAIIRSGGDFLAQY